MFTSRAGASTSVTGNPNMSWACANDEPQAHRAPREHASTWRATRTHKHTHGTQNEQSSRQARQGKARQAQQARTDAKRGTRHKNRAQIKKIKTYREQKANTHKNTRRKKRKAIVSHACRGNYQHTRQYTITLNP